MGHKSDMNHPMTPIIDPDFAKRRQAVTRRNPGITQGYLTSFNHDGIAIANIRRRDRHSPLRGLLSAVVLVVAFKAFAVGFLGPDDYDARIARLDDGTSAERIGAFILQSDPLTTAVVQNVGGLFRPAS